MRRVRDETEVGRRSKSAWRASEPRDVATAASETRDRGGGRKARTLTFEASMLCVRSLMVSASLVS